MSDVVKNFWAFATPFGTKALTIMFNRATFFLHPLGMLS